MMLARLVVSSVKEMMITFIKMLESSVKDMMIRFIKMLDFINESLVNCF